VHHHWLRHKFDEPCPSPPYRHGDHHRDNNTHALDGDPGIEVALNQVTNVTFVK
jgi:hypothetical protein